MTTSTARPKSRLFYGWYVVTGAFFAHWMGAGIGIPIFGLFFKPMSAELNWTRAMTTLPLVTRNVLSHLAGPIIGPLVDRFGPKYLMTGGAIIAGVGTMLMSQTNSLWQFFLFFAVIGAIGNAGLSNIVTNTTIAKWFVRKRGRATGIAAAGINVGEAIITPFVLLLITLFGWRAAWIGIGLVPWLVVAPASFFLMRRAPEDMGLLPDGDPPPNGERQPESEANQVEHTTDKSPNTSPDTSDEYVWTAKEAFKTPALWMIVLATNLAGLAVSGVVMHQIPFLTDQGLSQADAAMSLVTYAVFAVLSKLLWGFLAERIQIRYLTAASLLGSALGLVILIQADALRDGIIFGVVYGSTRGAWSVVQSLIWADYFGRRFLGTIRGFVAPIQLVSGIGGPLFAALVFDLRQSYILAFSIFVVSYILGALLILITQPPTPPNKAPLPTV